MTFQSFVYARPAGMLPELTRGFSRALGEAMQLPRTTQNRAIIEALDELRAAAQRAEESYLEGGPFA